MLRLITVPIVVFAIGYNRFRNQDNFLEVFDEHITTLIQKSVFFSVRNHGSIEKLKAHVPPELVSKIKKQSCPTTIMSSLHHSFSGSAATTNRRVAINAAFDRLGLRLGTAGESALNKFNSIISILKARALNPVIVAHKHDDLQILDYLTYSNEDLEVADLTNLSWDKVVEFYSTICLSVGMRGHSQMIPLGMRIPIFSIVTHDKMQYLLDDINHPEWGAELMAESFDDSFSRYIDVFLQRDNGLDSEIEKVVNELTVETRENIRSAFELVRGG